MTSLLEKGRHIEWLMGSLAPIFAKDARTLIDAELRLSNWDRQRPQQLALPLFPAAKNMDVCGVEYVARADSEPVRTFRWSRIKSDSFDVWMSFVSTISMTNDVKGVISDATNSCIKHINRIL
jgi:hypothetical protein